MPLCRPLASFHTSNKGLYTKPSSRSTSSLLGISSLPPCIVLLRPLYCIQAQNICLWASKAISPEQSSTRSMISYRRNTSCTELVFPLFQNTIYVEPVGTRYTLPNRLSPVSISGYTISFRKSVSYTEHTAFIELGGAANAMLAVFSSTHAGDLVYCSGLQYSRSPTLWALLKIVAEQLSMSNKLPQASDALLS